MNKQKFEGAIFFLFKSKNDGVCNLTYIFGHF